MNFAQRTRKRRHGNVLLFVAALLICLPALKTEAVDLTKWHLVFSDEFNDTFVNWNKWTLGEPWENAPGSPYLNVKANCIEGNGILRFRGDQKGSDGKYHTGGISSIQRFNYGYFEARVKVPSGQGMWPAFWLLNWYGNPEIDILELLGHEPGIAYATLQQLSPNGQYESDGSVDFSKGYHVFSCAWYADSIIMYQDNVKLCRWTRTANPTWPHWGTTAQMNVILNLQVGGDWPGMPDATTIFPGYYDVDYVRVYEAGGTTQSKVSYQTDVAKPVMTRMNTGKLDISFSGIERDINIGIYGCNGRLIRSVKQDQGSHAAIHFTGLPSGMYSVKIKTRTYTFTGVEFFRN